MQTAGVGEAAQKVALEPPAHKVDFEPTGSVPSPGAKDAIGVGSTKPHLDPAKTNAALAGVSGKVEPTQRKSAEKPREKDRVDRIGLEISALLAAESAANRTRSASPATRKSAHVARGDAFDPSKNPTAPGAPRPLGATVTRGIANDLAAESALGRRTD